MIDAALNFGRRIARLCDHVVETAIKPRKCVGDAIGRLLLRNAAGVLSAGCRGLRKAFELARQVVETIVDGGEVFANRIIVVVVVPDWSALVPHVFSIFEV